MDLKIFNKDTNSFEDFNIKSESIVKTDQNTIVKSVKTFNDISEAVNSKLSKNGDTINGTVFLGDDAKIKNVKKVGNVTYRNVIGPIEDEDGKVYLTVARTISNSYNTLGSAINLAADLQPTEGSFNLLTSGTLYGIIQDINDRLTALEQSN